MAKYKITKNEVKTRTGYILLGFFSLYIVEDLRTWVTDTLHINPIILGVIGLIATFYFFEF